MTEVQESSVRRNSVSVPSRFAALTHFHSRHSITHSPQLTHSLSNSNLFSPSLSSLLRQSCLLFLRQKLRVTMAGKTVPTLLLAMLFSTVIVSATATDCSQQALAGIVTSAGLEVGGTRVLACHSDNALSTRDAVALLQPAVDSAIVDSLGQGAMQPLLFYLEKTTAPTMSLTHRVATYAGTKGWDDDQEALLRLGLSRSTDNGRNQLAFCLSLTQLWFKQRRVALIVRRIRRSWLDDDALWKEEHAEQVAVLYSQATMRTAHSLSQYAETAAILDAMVAAFPTVYAIQHNRGLFHLTNYRWGAGEAEARRGQGRDS